MTDPVASCKLLGRWRIVEADLWDRDYLDMVEPAYLQIGRDGWAEFALGCVTAGGSQTAGRWLNRNRAVLRQRRRCHPHRPPRVTSSTAC
jgi:hypothetical protein